MVSVFRVIILAIAGAAGAGCFSARATRLEELRFIEERVVCRLRLEGGGVVRAIVEPGDATAKEVRCRPCAHEPSSWEVRYAGFPAVYSSGRHWREETSGEEVVIAAAEVTGVEIERFDWTRTLLAAPVLLPAGTIDFLVRNVRLGFDAVDDRFDDFSRPPGSGKVVEPP